MQHSHPTSFNIVECNMLNLFGQPCYIMMYHDVTWCYIMLYDVERSLTSIRHFKQHRSTSMFLLFSCVNNKDALWMRDKSSSSSILSKYDFWVPDGNSEIVFLRIELDKRSSLIQNVSKLPQIKLYVSQSCTRLASHFNVVALAHAQ